MLACLVLGSAIHLFSQLQEPTPPVNIIIDSDLALDADDVGDHAVLWALVSRGEARVIAIINSSANDYAAPAGHAIATYYGYPGVPVGAHKGATPNVEGSALSPYAQQITNEFGTPGETRNDYPDAVTVYRQALANAADNSVYIVANGYYQPLQGLLQSGPDAISPLTGVQLVARKVKRFVPSGGWFPSGNEHNFRVDADAASYVFAHWPGEIVSVGAQVGQDTVTGPSPTADGSKDPIKRAYDLYGSSSRAWGQAAILYAVRGGIGSTFYVGGFNGQTIVDGSTGQFPGSNFWSQTPSVGHSWVDKQISADQLGLILNPLLQASSLIPSVGSISPASLGAGSSAQTITLTGNKFFNDSQVLFNGSSRQTTFVTGTQLAVQLSSGDLAQVGNQALTVVNSTEGGWQSNAVNLNVFATTPTLSGISPVSATVGSGPITLTATGSGFAQSSVVQVNSDDRTTTFVSGTQLTATLTANDLATAGLRSITVNNPGGGTSTALTFTVNNPLPALSAMSPTNVIAGSSGFTLTLNGSNFVASSAVRVNGVDRPTTFVSGTRLTAAIPASDLATAKLLSITVASPGPGGGVTSALTFAVNNPVPTISSISPNPVLALGSSFTLTVNGTGYNSSSVVQVNGSPRPTTLVSPTQLQAQIPQADIIAVGQRTITVFNPTPGGGTSNAATLTVIGLLGTLHL